MSNGWSDRTKYNATYKDWLIADICHIVTLPYRGKDELLEGLRVMGVLLIWIVIMLTLPITLPIVSYVNMKRTKARLLQLYGKEELDK